MPKKLFNIHRIIRRKATLFFQRLMQMQNVEIHLKKYICLNLTIIKYMQLNVRQCKLHLCVDEAQQLLEPKKEM